LVGDLWRLFVASEHGRISFIHAFGGVVVGGLVFILVRGGRGFRSIDVVGVFTVWRAR
jgi:hypothetical protein